MEHPSTITRIVMPKFEPGDVEEGRQVGMELLRILLMLMRASRIVKMMIYLWKT
jgi:hypothetical protein